MMELSVKNEFSKERIDRNAIRPKNVSKFVFQFLRKNSPLDQKKKKKHHMDSINQEFPNINIELIKIFNFSHKNNNKL